MQWMKRLLRGMSPVLCAALLLQLPVDAKETNKIWGSIQDQQAILYMQDDTAPSGLECQIGNTAVTVSEITPTTELETPIQTYILIDNSMSIQEAQRPLVQEILEDLVGNRMNGESFSIAYLADGADWQCEDQTDYPQIKNVVDHLEYRLQETQLTDTLYNVVSELQESDQGILRRIIVIADGMDHKQMGYTRQELETLIQQAGYPIYTIGCTNTESNGQELLENFFALSRLTNATSVYLQEQEDAMSVVAQVTDWNNAYRVTVDLPDELCDGSTKTVLIKEAEREFTTSLTMPFAVVDTTPVEESQPEPEPEPVVEPEPTILDVLAQNAVFILLGVVIIVAVIVLIVVLIRRHKKEPESKPQPVQTAPAERDQGTVLIQDDGHTAFLWGDDAGSKRVILRDVANAARCYEAALDGVVPVGRDAGQCRIVIDYDMTVARHQCDIYMEGGSVMIRNCSTSNITKVNGERIYDPVALEDGSRIEMGRVRMTVETV